MSVFQRRLASSTYALLRSLERRAESSRWVEPIERAGDRRGTGGRSAGWTTRATCWKRRRPTRRRPRGARRRTSAQRRPRAASSHLAGRPRRRTRPVEALLAWPGGSTPGGTSPSSRSCARSCATPSTGARSSSSSPSTGTPSTSSCAGWRGSASRAGRPDPRRHGLPRARGADRDLPQAGRTRAAPYLVAPTPRARASTSSSAG